MLYKTIFIYFSHTKFTGIIHFFHAQHRRRILNNCIYIILANSIAQHNKHFIAINNIAGKPDGVPNALPVRLMYKMHLQRWIFIFNVVLNFITQVTHNKNKFINACTMQLINYYA